jgi:two-component sensor histidine kinase/PAS domain-containing protein
MMSCFKNRKLRRAFYSIVVAFAAVSLAIVLRTILGPLLGDSAPFVTFFPAVLVASLLGGWLAGVSATMLTIVAGALYFGLVTGNEPSLIAALLYVMGCGVSIAAAEKLRGASELYRKAEHKLATALSVSGVGTWRWDVARNSVECDERLCGIFGIETGASPKTESEFLNLVVEEDRAQVLEMIEGSLRKPHASEYVYRINHPLKGVRWIADRNNVLCGPDGAPIEIVGASMDVTERKQADEHRDLLIRELHHRVRNTLAMVQGMANATANSAQDLGHFKETFARRIASLAMTHALLTDAKTQSTTLARLVRQELEALGMAERLDLTGCDLLLPSELAVPIGMAMHELATNALKHGALRDGAGRISVHCALTDESGEIVWNEVGGPTVQPPERRGFGAQLLDRVIGAQLGASTTRVFSPEGVSVTISIPREKLIANANEPPAKIQAEAS